MAVDLSWIRSGTTNYEIYFDGTRLLGHGSIEIPDITYNTVEIKGAGTSGVMNMPTPGHTDSLELTINWRSIHDDLSLLNRPIGQNFVLYSSQHLYHQGTGAIKAQQVKISFRGIGKQMTLGTMQPSESTESKSVFEIDNLKIEVDGKEVIYIDKWSHIYRINGVDYLQDTRAALGLDW